ncbi:hypothetical protein ACRPOS_000290 [Bartonella heixiaziensis]|uniref:hypothetical protein n=1 Tax=Bartonella heixiaziensis TaxID=1461000 RepID=UPI003908B7CB
MKVVGYEFAESELSCEYKRTSEKMAGFVNMLFLYQDHRDVLFINFVKVGGAIFEIFYTPFQNKIFKVSISKVKKNKQKAKKFNQAYQHTNKHLTTKLGVKKENPFISSLRVKKCL